MAIWHIMAHFMVEGHICCYVDWSEVMCIWFTSIHVNVKHECEGVCVWVSLSVFLSVCLFVSNFLSLFCLCFLFHLLASLGFGAVEEPGRGAQTENCCCSDIAVSMCQHGILPQSCASSIHQHQTPYCTENTAASHSIKLTHSNVVQLPSIQCTENTSSANTIKLAHSHMVKFSAALQQTLSNSPALWHKLWATNSLTLACPEIIIQVGGA